MKPLAPEILERFIDYCHGRRLEMSNADGRELAKRDLMFRTDNCNGVPAYIITLAGWRLAGVTDDDDGKCWCCGKRR